MEQRDHKNQSAMTTTKKETQLKESKSMTKNPICGMTVDEASALHAERDGKTFYFCSNHCRQKFLSTPVGASPAEKSGGCCG